MEKSIGGDGYRTPLNSYMLADARAIADFARGSQQSAISAEYDAKAGTLEHLIETKLWNPEGSVLRRSLARNRLRHSQREAIQGPRHATPIRRRARTHRLHSLAVLCAHPEPRHRLEATLRSQRIRRQVRSHHRRAAQPALPLRLGRSMHVEWPLMAIRHHANLAGIGQFAQRPRTDVTSASSSTTNYSRTTFCRSTSSCPAVASSTGSTKISTPIPMNGSRRTCSSPRTSRWAAETTTIIPDSPIRSSRGSSACVRARIRRSTFIRFCPAGTWTYFAVDGLPYHGHLLAIVYDETGKQYRHGPRPHAVCRRKEDRQPRHARPARSRTAALRCEDRL